jgi:lipopolysaccharide transport system ATP-binding protein
MDNANKTVISVENLTKVYKLYNQHIDRLKEAIHPRKKKYHRRFFALENVSFQLGKGEIMGIIGKNGAGKSTLLKIITGVLSQTSGKVTVTGSISSMLELGTGFNPELTGMENIYLYNTIKGLSKEEIDGKVDDILAFADIGNFIHQPLKIYSSGMRARLGFATAIHVDPDILIVDEVLSVGDELFKRKCYIQIEKFMKAGKTILFVTHGTGTVLELCTRAILLDRGELILEGSPKLVTTHYQRLLFADSADFGKLREEIRQLNKDEKKKNQFTKDIKDKEAAEKEKDNRKETVEEITGWKKAASQQKEFYVEGFKPKSTIENRKYDVDILDIHIKTLAGERVNNLVMDREYIYTYTVRFHLDAQKISCAIAFRTPQGLTLSHSGGVKTRLDNIEKVKKGEEYLVQWRFKCTLLPRTYYVDVGVIGSIDGEDVYLNRISDANAFKVQKIPGLTYGNYVHLGQQVTVSKIDPKVK